VHPPPCHLSYPIESNNITDALDDVRAQSKSVRATHFRYTYTGP
jgi:hypothetical protein